MQLNIKKQAISFFKKWAEDIKRHFSKEDTQMVKKAHKKMFNTTETQGNASQNLNEYDLTTLRKAIIKMTNNDKCWLRGG